MKIFNKEESGEIGGRYKCDLCDIFLPISDRGYFEGYILTDMDNLSHAHLCMECVNENLLRPDKFTNISPTIINSFEGKNDYA